MTTLVLMMVSQAIKFQAKGEQKQGKLKEFRRKSRELIGKRIAGNRVENHRIHRSTEKSAGEVDSCADYHMAMNTEEP
jgi:hypothetical protein